MKNISEKKASVKSVLPKSTDTVEPRTLIPSADFTPVIPAMDVVMKRCLSHIQRGVSSENLIETVSFSVRNRLDELLQACLEFYVDQFHAIRDCDQMLVIFREHTAVFLQCAALRNRQGSSLIHLAAEADSVDLLMLFSEKNIDIDCPNSAGWHPIHVAAFTGQRKFVRRLIAMRPDRIDVADFQRRTPLMLATVNNQLGVVNLLVKIGSDVHARDVDGRTCLHWAVRNGDMLLVKILLKSGVDPRVADRFGLYPVDMVKNRDERIIRVLS